MISYFVDIILIFFYIFSFSFSGGRGIDSSMVVAILLTFIFIISKKYRNKLISFSCNSYSKRIVKYCYIIIIWSLLVVFANNTSDISFLLTFVHMIYFVVVGMMLYIYLYTKNHIQHIVNYIIIVFLIQSCIEWLAFLIIPIKDFIQTTKSEDTIKFAIEQYGGIRANALCGSDFFGLAVCYGAVYLLFLSQKNTLFASNPILKFISFVVLLSGTFFAGRSGYIGILFMIIYIIFNNRRYLHKMKPKTVISIFTIIIMSCIIVLYSIRLFSTNDDIFNLFSFTFQNLFNYAENGSMASSSTDSMKSMYFLPELKTLIFGDGRYYELDGSYYKHTDIGYLRCILYIGIFGQFMFLMLQNAIMRVRIGKERSLKQMLFLLVLVYNLKGEAVIMSQCLLALTVLYSLQDIFNVQTYIKRQ